MSSRPLSRPAPLRHPNGRHGDRHRAKSEQPSTPFRPSPLGRRFGDELLDVIVLRLNTPVSSEDAAQQWRSSGNQVVLTCGSTRRCTSHTKSYAAPGFMIGNVP